MTQLMNARVQKRPMKFRLPYVATRLDALLHDAVKHERTFLKIVNHFLAEETESKQRKRVTMGLQLARFPGVKTIDTFYFAF